MIYVGSRYADQKSRVVALDRGDGVLVKTVYRNAGFTGTAQVVYYTWVYGDRIDRVAYELLGDGSRWWEILDLNPEILDPSNILPGTRIRVPSV